MKKKIKRSKLLKTVKKLNIDSICTFKEKPSNTEIRKDKMNAAELFSFFTADIIKEDLEFVR